MNRTRNARVCIIGAGPSGITAGKNLIQVGIRNFVIYEKNDQAGGNWVFNDKTQHSSVYETTLLISSRRHSEYFDYPMPVDYPDYPSHAQMPEDVHKRIQHHIQYMQRQYINSPRHTIEVEYHKHIRELTREIPAFAPVWGSK